ncbi:hypothetical protein X777_06117 [Ooceraea biroi]|uniref:Uncharacterized protein n=1 Tax=Ooceraea biroi TaxID=2015173 RepID=A0A026X1N0_OOCBI|nr:hypothetical protein X777_06117 [Ooceraea biroi]
MGKIYKEGIWLTHDVKQTLLELEWEVNRLERHHCEIALLPERWEKVVENGGNYFD